MKKSQTRNYNYCCLFSKDDKCKNHGKNVVKQSSGKESEVVKCDLCGSGMKLMGQALNVVFIGTQESKIKKGR